MSIFVQNNKVRNEYEQQLSNINMMQNSNDDYKQKWKNVCTVITDVAKNTIGSKRPVNNNLNIYSNKIENLSTIIHCKATGIIRKLKTERNKILHDISKEFKTE